jgi:hypothetical protein
MREYLGVYLRTPQKRLAKYIFLSKKLSEQNILGNINHQFFACYILP